MPFAALSMTTAGVRTGDFSSWAGCEYGDLEQSVAVRGVDGALEQLRDAGVYLTLEEFKRMRPISRPGLTFEPDETDFDNPLATSGGIQGATSGSRAVASKVMYDWGFVSEESANDLLLACHHGVMDAPLALWYPVLPSVAGVHNLLINLRFGRPPARWFSQVDPGNLTFLHRLSIWGIRWGGRAAGLLRSPAGVRGSQPCRSGARLDDLGERTRPHDRGTHVREFGCPARGACPGARPRSIGGGGLRRWGAPH